MSNKLFVGNLSFNTTENDLQDAFAAHGTVVEVNLMMDRVSGRPRGFGFVTMGSPEEAQKAIDGLHGKQLDGRALTVNIARPREDVLPAAAVAAVVVAISAAVAVAVAVASATNQRRFHRRGSGEPDLASFFVRPISTERSPAGPRLEHS